MASIVAAAVVAFVMLFLTGLLYSLPSAALGGILIAAAWILCDFQEFRRMWRFRGVGLVGARLTMAGVVGIGVLFCLIIVLRALAFPDDAVLGHVGPEEFRDLKRHPGRLSTRWEPALSRLIVQPMRRRAANTCFALAAGHGDSCRHREESPELRNRLFVIEAIGNHTQCQRFSLGNGLFLGLPVHHHAWQVRHFGDPPPVFLALDFDPHG